MPSLPVKAYRKDEIRRFRLETGDDETHFGYNRLMKKIYRLFPISERSNVRLMWKGKTACILQKMLLLILILFR